MNICFFGVGGVGGYFGSLITEKFGKIHNIYFKARGKHKEAICNNGLTLKYDNGKEIVVFPKLCSDSIIDIPICDIIILSVKSYDLDNAINEINKISSENTIILPLLNGVDIYERIKARLNNGVVLPSCVYVGTHIESPGIIFQKGGSCKISLGVDPDYPNTNLDLVFSIFRDANINFDLEENVNIAIWSKYMFIASFGLTTAVYNKTLGEIINDTELSAVVKSIMNEIKILTEKLCIPLPDDIVEKSYLKANQFPYETKTSFQRDVELKGKINEGDLFGGTIIRYGEKFGISTPRTKYIYQKLLEF